MFPEEIGTNVIFVIVGLIFCLHFPIVPILFVLMYLLFHKRNMTFRENMEHLAEVVARKLNIL